MEGTVFQIELAKGSLTGGHLWGGGQSFFLIGVQLLYNVVLVSTDSTVSPLYIYMCPLFFGFPSHLGHHRVLSIVPRAI